MYSVYRSDRCAIVRGGGSAILIKNHFKSSYCISTSLSAYFQIVIADLFISPNRSLRLCCAYRSPMCSVMATDELPLFLNEHMEQHMPIIIAGDFNMPNVDWNSSGLHIRGPFSKIVGFIAENSLSQMVSSSTRGDNLLDLVFTNNPNDVSLCQIGPPFALSDHCSVEFSFRIRNYNRSNIKYVKDFAHADYDIINRSIAGIDWTLQFSKCSSVDHMYQLFVEHVHSVIDNFVPVRRVRNSNTFYPKFVRSNIKKVRKSWKLIFRNGVDRYFALSKRLRKSIRRYKNSYEASLSKHKNTRRFFSYTKKKLRNVESIGPMKTCDGTTIFSDTEIADAFSEYYHTAIDSNVNIFSDHTVPPVTSVFMDYVSITQSDVYKKLRHLPNRFSCSPDELPYVFLRKAALSLTSPVVQIFNRSLLTGQIPQIWKTAFIRPIFKKGNKQLCENYRPISLTCSLSKVLERLIIQELRLYFRMNSFFVSSQHGFLNRRSTGTLLLECLRKWHSALDSKDFIDCAYIDFKKAFDMVPIPCLISKLKSYGIKGCLLNWISNFLTDRKQAVKINDEISEFKSVSRGVPQGTVGGPFYFLIYINDLPQCLPPSTHCYLFADDVKVFTINNSPPLQDVFDHIKNWSRKWYLPLAPNKTAILHFGRNNPKLPLCDGATALTSVTSIRDLGITISIELKFDIYIENIVKLATTRSNMILRSFTTSNLIVLSRLFKIYVRPLLEYNTFVWSPHTARAINFIENVQRRFTKRIFLRNHLHQSYEMRLRELQMETLEVRRLQNDLIMTYKIIHSLVDLSFDNYFTWAPLSNTTRSHHNYKLFVPHNKMNYFNNRVVRYWNSLPQSVVESHDLNIFIRKLKSVPCTSLDFSSRITS